jgi:hypothetical protein
VCTYQVDAQGRITFVDERWMAFARENAAPRYADTATLYGMPLLSFICDSTTKHIYTVLMDRVRRERVTMRVPFRCDAPDRRRWLELTLTPQPDEGIAFESRTLRVEPRERVVITEQARGAEALMRMCSWCKRVAVPGAAWVEVEEAVARLRLFGDEDVPQITHGICPGCVTRFEDGRGVAADPA